MITLWGNREGRGLSDLRMNFKTKFIQSNRKIYCQQCFRYDKIFRGKLEVHSNPFTNSIWVEFCDVSIRNRHTGDILKTCYVHTKIIVFTIENKAKCLKFLKYIMRCAEIEMDFPENKERIIRELKFHEIMKARITREIEMKGRITRKLEFYEKMKEDEDKKNQMKKKHEEEKDEVNFKFDSKTEWPELSEKKVKEEKKIEKKHKEEITKKIEAMQLDEKTKEEKEEEERKHEELFNFHSKTEWPDLMEME